MTDDRMSLQRPRKQNRWPLFGTQTLGARASCPQNLLTSLQLSAGWKPALPGRSTALLRETVEFAAQRLMELEVVALATPSAHLSVQTNETATGNSAGKPVLGRCR